MGGNTLVIELLAKNLARLNNSLKTHYALQDLLADLQSKGLLELSQTKAVDTDYQSKQQMRHETPEAIIGAMYELGDLPPGELTLLAVFAVLPAESIAFETLEKLLPETDKLDGQLLSLAQKGWIENKEGTAFKCSPVVQEVVKAKRGDLLADCRKLVEALIRELTRDVLHLDNYRHSSLFASFAETVVGVLNQHDDDLGTLCQNIGIFHTATGDLNKVMVAYQKMEGIYSALAAESPDNERFKNGLAISYEKLGSTQSALGNLEKALTYFEDETKLFEALYEAYPQNVSFKNGLAISYYKLGQLYESKEDYQKAFEYYEQDFKFTELTLQSSPDNASYRRNLRISFNQMGAISEKLGKDELAKNYYEKAKELE